MRPSLKSGKRKAESGKSVVCPPSSAFFLPTFDLRLATFDLLPSSSGRSGLTLIGIIAAIVIMGLLGAGVLMLVSTGSMESIQTLKSGQSFYAAESGVSAAKAYMGTNPIWFTNSSTFTGVVGQASFVANIDTHGQITSVGSEDEAQWKSIWRPTWHAMLVYGTRTNLAPMYRIWGGTNWSNPSNALSIGATCNWVVVKACPRRDEYIAVTIGSNRVVKAQVFGNGIWSNLQTIATNSALYRGADVAYETLSGDAIVVASQGTADPTCYVWNGASWSGPSTLNLSRVGVVNWINLASDPVSDEIVALVHDAGNYYSAQVWSGSAWGNERLPAALGPSAIYEAMALAYETSGNQAVIVTANGTLGGIKSSTWSGAAWSSEVTTTIGNDFLWGTLVNDPNSDNLLLSYIDIDVDVGKVFWNGAIFGANFEFDISAEAIAARCIDGVFETISTNAGHAIVAYGDGAIGVSRHAIVPSGATWDAAVAISTFDDTATMQVRRTGDGKILAISYNLTSKRYDFAWHNGTTWSTAQILESAPSVGAVPYKESFMMAPQRWVLP